MAVPTYIFTTGSRFNNRTVQHAAAAILQDPSHELQHPVSRTRLRELCLSDDVEPVVALCYCTCWEVEWPESSDVSFLEAIQDSQLAANLALLRSPEKLLGKVEWSDRQKAFALLDNQRLNGRRFGTPCSTLIVHFLLRQRPGQGIGYVQDTWAERSHQLLRPCIPGFKSLTFQGDHPVEHYEAYCRFVDGLAGVQHWTGSETETALFGDLERRGRDNGTGRWRAFVGRQPIKG